jgi:hypothetical protein
MRARLAVMIAAAALHLNAAQVAIQFENATPAPLPCTSGVVVAAPICSAGACPAAQRAQWPGTATFTLDRSVAWDVRLEARACWAPALDVAPNDSRTQLNAPVWRRGTLDAKVVAPRGATVPPAATATFEHEHLTYRAACTIVEQRLRCDLPAMTTDLRFEIGGFAPVYVWQRAIGGEASSTLPDLILRRGASLAGRVAAPDRAATVTDTIVHVIPLSASAGSAEELRLAAQTRTMRADERGFFQFTDLEEGRYEVRATKAGWSPSPAVVAVLEPDRETVLAHSLAVEPLVTFEVDIRPPLAPDGAPWLVRVREASRRGGEAHESAANDEGRWRSDAFAAGRYHVEVRDRAQNVYHDEGLEVTPANARLSVQIAAVPVRGRVTFGGKPFIARVKFSRQTGRRAFLDTDDEGVFTGALPDEGTWDVEVIPNHKSRGVRIDPVEVRRAEGAAFAELDIVLRGGSIRGRLVDERRNGTRGVVTVYQDRRFITSDSTQDDGTFALVGIPEGEIELRGTARDADTGIVRHRVSGNDGSVLELALRRSPRVHGVLVTPSGRAIAGAAIRYSSDGTRAARETISGPDGRFELQLASSDTRVDVIVVAPPFAVKMLSLTADPQPKEIVLDRAAGTLLIRAHSNLGAYVRRGTVTAALLALMAPRSYGPPAEWTPRGWMLDLEPGAYLICRSYAASDDSCRAANVVAGTEQIVDLAERTGT